MVNRTPDTTRQALLYAAFLEINKNGFQAASLGNILKETDVTKGALYHHFPSKLEMGYAVVDELITETVKEMWVTPLENADNILDALLEQIDNTIAKRDEKNICFGCPVNNLAQEMSPIDEGFRKRINAIFDLWQKTINNGLKEGQEKDYVNKSIDTNTTAYFIVAAIEGATSLAKNAKSVDVLKTSLEGLKQFIETLRT